MWPLQDGAGKPVMMTQQPGSHKWDSWEMNAFAFAFALLGVTDEGRKVGQNHRLVGCTTGPRRTAAWAVREGPRG